MCRYHDPLKYQQLEQIIINVGIKVAYQNKPQLRHNCKNYQATLIKSLFISCPIPHLLVLPADSEDLIFSTSSHSQACFLLYTVHRKKCACVQETVAFMKPEMLSVVALIM